MPLHLRESVTVGIELKILGQCDDGARMIESIQIKSILSAGLKSF
jgi:hypothetical protein